MGNVANLFAMGGYGGYVWPAYGLTALAFAGLLIWTRATLKARRREEQSMAALGKTRRARREAGQ